MQNNDPFVDVDVGNIIDEYLEEKSRPKTIGAYYPSEIGMCMRRSYYSYFISKPTETSALRIFALGNNVHEFIAKTLKGSSTLAVAEEEKPIRITYADENTKFTIYGRIDDYIETKTGKKIIIEAKYNEICILCFGSGSFTFVISPVDLASIIIFLPVFVSM